MEGVVFFSINFIYPYLVGPYMCV